MVINGRLRQCHNDLAYTAERARLFARHIDLQPVTTSVERGATT
ncbi:hypothetical protein C4K04_4695 [Pseudomonas chlororaphis]|uniref:Uncharacterized protein n=1 Tax=Pseudomonas chlororaphis TaxID=587753 RepID=A0A3G7TTJ1_9PSED|nr:hypothetical protein C4K04_4695 [Pseudomonas chlororaphis]